MKRTSIIGLCLAAVCAMFAIGATSAFAVEGSLEFGKCVAKAGGKFSNAGCTKLATKPENEKDEWEPLEGKVFPFTSAKKATTGNAVLESKGGNSVSCTGLKQTKGEYGPGKDEVKNVVGEFSGCEGLSAKCSNEGKAEGLVNTTKLHGELGVVTRNATNEEKNIDGSDLQGQTSEFLAEFSCGPVPILTRAGILTKVGAVVNGVFKSNTNKMLSKSTVEFKAAPGAIQEPEVWEPQGTGVTHSSKAKVTEHLEAEFGAPPAPFEQSSESLVVEQKSLPTTAKIEVRQCKQGAKAGGACP